jgi:hypothetical protein
MAMDFLNESLNSMISIKDYGIHGVHVPLGIKFLNPIILTNNQNPWLHKCNNKKQMQSKNILKYILNIPHDHA